MRIFAALIMVVLLPGPVSPAAETDCGDWTLEGYALGEDEEVLLERSVRSAPSSRLGAGQKSIARTFPIADREAGWKGRARTRRGELVRLQVTYRDRSLDEVVAALVARLGEPEHPEDKLIEFSSRSCNAVIQVNGAKRRPSVTLRSYSSVVKERFR